MQVPTELAVIYSPPQITEDDMRSAMETELLTDYYLVPGASWSLLKKGERVQVLGKVQETGWYRCIALRNAQVKLDHSAFSVLTMTTGAEHMKTRSFDERCALSEDSGMEASSVAGSVTSSMADSMASSYQDLHQHETSISSTSSLPLSPLPLLTQSCPPVSVMNERAEIFHMEWVGAEYEQATPIEEEAEEDEEVLEAVPFGEEEEVREIDDAESSFVMVNYPNTGVHQEQESVRSPEFGSVPTLLSLSVGGAARNNQHERSRSVPAVEVTQKQSIVQVSVENVGGVSINQPMTEGSAALPSEQTCADSEDPSDRCGMSGAEGEVGVAEGEVVLRSNGNGNKVERPLSYKLATDEEQSLENLLNEVSLKVPETGGSIVGRSSDKERRIARANVKRSTSTVTHSSQAAITLRRTLGTTRGVKAQSSRISSSGLSLPASFSSVSAARDSLLMWSRLDDLVKKELGTGTYPAPLIGCIPPSALKMFADMNKKEKRDAVAPSSPSGHSHSENSDGTSRPVSGIAETPEQSKTSVDQEPSDSRSKAHTDTPPSSSEQSAEQTLVSQEAARNTVSDVGGDRSKSSTKAALERSGSLPGRKNSKGSLTNSGQYPRLTRSGTTGSYDDSDSEAEADRHMARMFHSNQTINPDEDVDLLTVKHKATHVRANSLPPSMVVDIVRDDESPPPPLPPRMCVDDDDDEGDDGGGREEEEGKMMLESSLDRSPRHMKKLLKGPSLDSTFYATSHSVGSSPAHAAGTPRTVGKGLSVPDPHNGVLESSSPSKPGLLKKLFNRSKTKLTPTQNSAPQATPKLYPPDPTGGRLSPGLLKHVLLGQQEQLEVDLGPRLRMASISGRSVRQEGMAILIGDDSSSDSEAEGEADTYSRHSNTSSLLDDANFSENVSGKDDSTSASPCNGATSSLEDKGGGNAEEGGVRKPRGRSAGEGWRTLPRDMGKTRSPGDAKASELSAFSSGSRLKRSVSDHDSLSLKAAAAIATPTDPYGKPGSSSSLKRHLSSSSIVKLMVKKGSRSMTSPISSPAHQAAASVKKGRQSKKKKNKLPPPSSLAYVIDAEDNLPLEQAETSIKMTGIIRQPPHGEKRYVYLDPSDGRFGFRLQSYGHTREQGQVLQTFVQSVAPGTPAFMAGLYPGDAIVEVNGVDVKYSHVDSVVEAIKKGADKGERILLKVEFVDGVTRLDCMQKADDFKNEIKLRQARLKELLKEEKILPPHTFSIPSPSHIKMAKNLPVWADTPITSSEDANKGFPYNKQLNQAVCCHGGGITGVECSALVMPISSCYRSDHPGDNNLLLQLLRSGGPALLDDLSLAKQCKIGDNIVTWGHDLPAKYIYHCVFGDLEESLQSCCYKALESASEDRLSTVVFWLDGFASLKVSPQLVIEAVRHWMQQDISRNTFHRVVFSSSANSSLVEEIMRCTFPLCPVDVRDSVSLSSDTARAAVVHNGIHKEREGDGEEELDDVLETILGLITSLQVEEESNVSLGKAQSQDILGGGTLEEFQEDIFRHQSLPQSSLLEDSANIPGEWSRRSLSPSSLVLSHGSVDLVLNPDRMESDV